MRAHVASAKVLRANMKSPNGTGHPPVGRPLPSATYYHRDFVHHKEKLPVRTVLRQQSRPEIASDTTECKQARPPRVQNPTIQAPIQSTLSSRAKSRQGLVPNQAKSQLSYMEKVEIEKYKKEIRFLKSEIEIFKNRATEDQQVEAGAVGSVKKLETEVKNLQEMLAKGSACEERLQKELDFTNNELKAVKLAAAYEKKKFGAAVVKLAKSPEKRGFENREDLSAYE